MAFINIAQNYISNFSEGRICPDQYVGNITVNNNSISLPNQNAQNDDFDMRTDLTNFVRANNPLIILILESPHIKEYAGNQPKPAAGNGNGDTGRAIRELLNTVLVSYNFTIPTNTYSLIIMNAVQYQCSLGEKPNKYRNKVFLDCWNSFGKQNFEVRLNNLFQNNDIIINACTKGTDRPYSYLRDLVEESILVTGTNSHIKLQHPCRWRMIYNTANRNNIPVNYNW